MKRRGEFNLSSSLNTLDPSAEHLIEAERDWKESWEPSSTETTAQGPEKTQGVRLR